jgi:hypothetical protein
METKAVDETSDTIEVQSMAEAVVTPGVRRESEDILSDSLKSYDLHSKYVVSPRDLHATLKGRFGKNFRVEMRHNVYTIMVPEWLTEVCVPQVTIWEMEEGADCGCAERDY